MDVTLALQVTVNGLLLGGIYALATVGLALVFGVMNVVNIAHGDFMIVGATLTFVGMSVFAVPFWIALLLSIGAVSLLGAAIQRALLERIRASDEMISLVMLFGVGTILAHSQAAVLGTNYFSIPVWVGSIRVSNLFVSRPLAISFGVAIAMTCGLLWVLKFTHLGRSIRATAMEAELASALGVNTGKVRLIVFAIGTAFAATSGGLLVTSQALNPLSGPGFLLIAFTACVLGGLGNIGGALVGSLVIGLVEVWAGLLVGAAFAQLAIYALFLLVVLVRPTGLLASSRQVI